MATKYIGPNYGFLMDHTLNTLTALPTVIQVGTVITMVSKDTTQVRFHYNFNKSNTSLINNLFISDQEDRNSLESEVNVEMQRCGAYEVVQLSRQRVTMKENPAYVDVSLHHHRNSQRAH